MENLETVSPGESSDEGEVLSIPIKDVPIERISIYNLVFASAACLGEYLDKLHSVEQGMKAALAAGQHFSQQQLQQTLDDTARFGESLLCDELGERCRLYGPFAIDWKAVDFQQKLVAVLLDFPRGVNGEGPQLNCWEERTFTEVIQLLQHHAKCIKILQLLHQLKRKELWTRRALESLVRQLCLCSFDDLPSRFEDLLPLYAVALNSRDMSPAAATRFMQSMPDEMQAYAKLFENNSPSHTAL
ncbi:hypothetical protein Emed_000653 [Eimeria media]